MAKLSDLHPGDPVWAEPAGQRGEVDHIVPRAALRKYPVVVKLADGTKRSFRPEELRKQS